MIGLGANIDDAFLLEVQSDDGTWQKVGDFVFTEGEGVVPLPGINARNSLQCANNSLRILRVEDGKSVVVAQRII